MHHRKPFSYIDAPPCELRENLLKKVGILKKAMDLLRIGELDQNYKSDFLPDKKKEEKSSAGLSGKSTCKYRHRGSLEKWKKKQKIRRFVV